MQSVCVRGVVRGGQVVLEVPLELPDGTEVTVTDGNPAKPKHLTPSEEYKLNLLTALNRLDLMEDPDWQAKVEPDRIAHTEKLILAIAGMRTKREGQINIEQQTNLSRGPRE